MKVTIEYCVECMFLGRALETAEAILERYAERMIGMMSKPSSHVTAVTLKPGSYGIYNVFVDGEPIYKVGPDGLPPKVEEIVEKLGRSIQSR
ncbi:MAG: Rdx family protein [Candidatus Bipolaricaulia bacterium]